MESSSSLIVLLSTSYVIHSTIFLSPPPYVPFLSLSQAHLKLASEVVFLVTPPPCLLYPRPRLPAPGYVYGKSTPPAETPPAIFSLLIFSISATRLLSVLCIFSAVFVSAIVNSSRLSSKTMSNMRCSCSSSDCNYEKLFTEEI